MDDKILTDRVKPILTSADAFQVTSRRSVWKRAFRGTGHREPRHLKILAKQF